LNRLATLTYAGEGCHDPLQVRRDAAEFFRELRGLLGVAAFPYLWVPEWHPGGHGLHVHFAVGRFIRVGLLKDAWPRGFVSIKLLSDLRVPSGPLDEARLAAFYLSKYAGKAFDERRVQGLHRYEVGEGFQPVREVIRGRTEAEVLARACELMGGPPAFVTRSSEWEGWRGPPACWAQWG
jgi:hypothetical protein